jgi:DNA-binding NarL/FixJ family response regulator
MENGYYFSDHVSTLMLKTLMQKNKATPQFRKEVALNEREVEVLRLICAGKTAVEIGKEIFLSHRTVEGIRASLMEKTGTHNTAGLVMYAVKQRIVE